MRCISGILSVLHPIAADRTGDGVHVRVQFRLGEEVSKSTAVSAPCRAMMVGQRMGFLSCGHRPPWSPCATRGEPCGPFVVGWVSSAGKDSELPAGGKGVWSELDLDTREQSKHRRLWSMQKFQSSHRKKRSPPPSINTQCFDRSTGVLSQNLRMDRLRVDKKSLGVPGRSKHAENR